MSKIFAKWNEGELASYLIEITAKILDRKDDVTGEGYVVDYVSTTRLKFFSLCLIFPLSRASQFFIICYFQRFWTRQE